MTLTHSPSVSGQAAVSVENGPVHSASLPGSSRPSAAQALSLDLLQASREHARRMRELEDERRSALEAVAFRQRRYESEMEACRQELQRRRQIVEEALDRKAAESRQEADRHRLLMERLTKTKDPESIRLLVQELG